MFHCLPNVIETKKRQKCMHLICVTVFFWGGRPYLALPPLWDILCQLDAFKCYHHTPRNDPYQKPHHNYYNNEPSPKPPQQQQQQLKSLPVVLNGNNILAPRRASTVFRCFNSFKIGEHISLETSVRTDFS